MKSGLFKASAYLRLFLTLMFCAAAINAHAFTFTKIADTDTPIPGGQGFFESLEEQAASSQAVIFRGRGSNNQAGVYRYTDGALNVVADKGTLMPGGVGPFDQFGNPSLDGANVAFDGGDSTFRGVYADLGLGLEVIADVLTPVPDQKKKTGRNFSTLDSTSVDGAEVAFKGSGGGVIGVYATQTKKNGGRDLRTVVDTTTSIPGGAGLFTNFADVSADGGDVAFTGQGDFNQRGAYIRRADSKKKNSIEVIADISTPIPDSTGFFTTFSGLSLDDGNVAFNGRSTGVPITAPGIYINRGAGLEVVADENTLIPEHGATLFTSAGNLSVDGSNVAFYGSAPGIQGVYVELGGVLMKVIESDDTLDGKQVQNTGIPHVADSFQDGILGVWVRFTDNSEGVFTTNTNAP